MLSCEPYGDQATYTPSLALHSFSLAQPKAGHAFIREVNTVPRCMANEACLSCAAETVLPRTDVHAQ